MKTLNKVGDYGQVTSQGSIESFDAQSGKTTISAVRGRIDKSTGDFAIKNRKTLYSANEIKEALESVQRYLVFMQTFVNNPQGVFNENRPETLMQDIRILVEDINKKIEILQNSAGVYKKNDELGLAFSSKKVNGKSWKQRWNEDARQWAKELMEQIAGFEENWTLGDISSDLKGLLGELQLVKQISAGIDKCAAEALHTAYDKTGIFEDGSTQVLVSDWKGETENCTCWLQQKPTQNKSDLVIQIKDEKTGDITKELGVSVKSYTGSQKDSQSGSVQLVSGTNLSALLAFNLTFYNTIANIYSSSYYESGLPEFSGHLSQTAPSLYNDALLKTKQMILIQALAENFYKLNHGAKQVDFLIIKNITTGSWHYFTVDSIIKLILTSDSATLDKYFTMTKNLIPENEPIQKFEKITAEHPTPESGARERMKKLLYAYKNFKINVSLKLSPLAQAGINWKSLT